MASENLTAVTDATFDEVVKRSALPVVVDFWAEWCGPCRMVGPFFADLAVELAGKMAFTKLNVDQANKTASALAVRSIPTFVVFKGGVEVHRFSGAMDKESLRKELSPFVG